MRQLLIIAFIFFVSGTGAQTPLVPGSAVPDMEFKTIFNYKEKSARLSGFGNKVVLLDFWSTFCSSCIEKMPQLASLQEKFKDGLQVFLVTKENLATVEKFFSRKKDFLELGLPMLIQPEKLHSLFPHQSIPHVVWIGRDCKVKAITTAEHVTEKNISDLMEKGDIDLPQKKDILDYETGKPLLYRSDAWPFIINGSVLLREMEGLPSGSGVAKFAGRIKYHATNQSLLALYAEAYRYKLKILPGNDKHAVKINQLASGSVLHPDSLSNLYSYELVSDDSTFVVNRPRMYSYIQKDLDRLFNIRSTVRTVRKECYIIKPFKNTTAMEPGPSSVNTKLETEELVNQPAELLAAYLPGLFPLGLPVMYRGPARLNITMELKKNYNTFGELRSDLLRYGFDLKKARRKLKVLHLAG
jgi:thiol-disulfide isomerase/thioredoxin